MQRIGAGPVRDGGEPDAGAAGGSAVARPRGGSGTGGHRVAEGPVEEYLVVAWPAPPAPEQIHHQSDRFGAEVRQSAARARPVPERRVDPVRARMDEFLRRVHEGR